MNVIEIKRLDECRKLLESISPECPVDTGKLHRVKDTLDDMLEFQFFPTYVDALVK